MSADSYSSDSSIAEEASLSCSAEDTRPEEIDTPYDLAQFDEAEEEEEEQKDEEKHEATATRVAAVDSRPAASAASFAAAAVPPLSDEFRTLLQAQPPPFSPIKSTPAAAAAAAPALAPAPAASVSVAAPPLPPPLGILDPRQRPADSEAAQALSRTESHPMLAQLITRMRMKHQPITASGRDSSTATAAASVKPAPSALQSTVAPLPPAVLGSLLDRLRSTMPASKSSWALQPDLLPVPAPPHPSHPARTSVLQAQLDQQRAAFYSAAAATFPDDKENAIAIAVSADPSYAHPPAAADCCRSSPLAVDARRTAASRFPPSAQPLQLAVAQTRMQAALLSMRTHQFRTGAVSLPQPQRPCDFGATLITQKDAAASTPMLDSAAALNPSLPSTRHACSNPSAIHRDPWLDPVLNRLYAARSNPTSNELEAAATRQLHASIVQCNSLRTQRDLFQAANRSFFQCSDQP